MLGHFPLWRRKRMRYIIAGCLGISVVASLMLVLGTVQGNPQTLMLNQDPSSVVNGNSRYYRDLYHHGNQDLIAQSSSINNKKTSWTTVATLLRVAIKQNDNIVAGYHGNRKVLRPRAADRRKDYNSDDGNYQGDTGYYSNEDEDEEENGKILARKADIRKDARANLVEGNHHHDYGFVIEDNAADYGKDYNDEDEDYEEEGYEDDYRVNPAFKPGDFDYSLLNKSRPVLPGVKLKFEEVGTNLAGDSSSNNNGSHVYNAIQYKGMHLLEDTQQDRKVPDLVGDDEDDTNDIVIGNRSKKSSEKVITLREVVHNTKNEAHPPCIPGQDCPSKIFNSDQNTHLHQTNATRFHRVDNNYRLGSQYDDDDDDDDDDDIPVKTSQQALLQNVKEKLAESRIRTVQSRSPSSVSPSMSDYNNINYNARQWIETQIPIQDGGVDANWLLQDQPATQIQMPELPWQPGEVRSPGGIPLIVDKIYWSKEVEDLIPKGISDEDFQHFLHKLYTTPVREMRPPQWNRCGRPRNQYVVLKDGTALCARHREEHYKLIHGEVLSFYLSRILGLDNIPIVMLSRASRGSPQWAGMDLAGAGWNESSLVALIQWVDGLESERSRVKMPAGLLEAFETGGVFDRTRPGVHELSANNLTQLVQWSDMILFDYLTGHYDRVASMQDGAEREHKPSIMHENIRNLRKVWQTGKMWLIDNESGLLDGYELLYHGGEMGRKFVQFHIQMLRTNCVFRRETVQKILLLAGSSSPHQELVRYASAQDPLYKHLPYAKESLLFQKYFPIRLKEVVDWINKCLAR